MGEISIGLNEFTAGRGVGTLLCAWDSVAVTGLKAVGAVANVVGAADTAAETDAFCGSSNCFKPSARFFRSCLKASALAWVIGACTLTGKTGFGFCAVDADGACA